MQVFSNNPKQQLVLFGKFTIYSMFIIWLSCLLCITLHELGHAIVVVFFGGIIYSININPITLLGCVNHSTITNEYYLGLISIAGSIGGSIGVLIIYMTQRYLATIISALCSIAELLNYLPTSDITKIITIFGPSKAYFFILINALILCVILYISFTKIYGQLKIYRSTSNLEI